MTRLENDINFNKKTSSLPRAAPLAQAAQACLILPLWQEGRTLSNLLMVTTPYLGHLTPPGKELLVAQ